MDNYMGNTPTVWQSNEVRISTKAYLTIREAASYFNLGEKKLREITGGDRCPYVLYCGSKRLI